MEHDFGGKANRWYPSTSFAGPPPRSGEDRYVRFPLHIRHKSLKSPQ